MGLYAPLNEAWLRSLGVDDVLGGEFEGELTAIAESSAISRARTGHADTEEDSSVSSVSFCVLRGGEFSADFALPRLHFLVPDRSGLPPLSRYATLQMADGTERIVGSTEASRGCRHLCRHCPVVPIYNGQFRVVQPDIVLADIDAQVAAGAEHITFGDPDFFNGPGHAMRIVEALHAAHPRVSYDVTIKIEHLLQHRDLLPRLAATGCAFVTSAVESLDDRVLALLDKGHTRADFLEAVRVCRAAGVTLAPTFVAFHPWTSLDGYLDLLDTLADLDLVEHVAPIQLAIRLLVPQGSRLLELEEMRRHLDAFNPATLAYPWAHPDPARRRAASRRDVARRNPAGLRSPGRVRRDSRPRVRPRRIAVLPWPRLAGSAAPVPFLSEPWYCCAEPNLEQVGSVGLGLGLRAEALSLEPSEGEMPRVLLLATTTGYQTRAFGEAAERLGVELVFATDRCDMLEDPWQDHAIPIRFYDEERSVRSILDASSTRPIDGVLVVGDRPAVIGARVLQALGLPGHSPEAAAIAGDKQRTRERFRDAGLPVPWFVSAKVARTLASSPPPSNIRASSSRWPCRAAAA